MELEIRVWYTGGVLVPGHPGPIPDEYRIYDRDTGTQIVETVFDSRDAAQVYLDLHRAEILQRGLPPLERDREALLTKVIPKLEEQYATASPDPENAARTASMLRRLGKHLSDADLRQRAEALLQRLGK